MVVLLPPFDRRPGSGSAEFSVVLLASVRAAAARGAPDGPGRFSPSLRSNGRLARRSRHVSVLSAQTVSQGHVPSVAFPAAGRQDHPGM